MIDRALLPDGYFVEKTRHPRHDVVGAEDVGKIFPEKFEARGWDRGMNELQRDAPRYLPPAGVRGSVTAWG